MDQFLFFLSLLLIIFVVPYFVAKAARNKGRSFGAWYAITVALGVLLWFVGWLIAGIIVASMKPEQSRPAGSPSPPVLPPPTTSPVAIAAPVRPTKRCPACAEDVLAEARKCKHWGEDLSAPSAGP